VHEYPFHKTLKINRRSEHNREQRAGNKALFSSSRIAYYSGEAFHSNKKEKKGKEELTKTDIIDIKMLLKGEY